MLPAALALLPVVSLLLFVCSRKNKSGSPVGYGSPSSRRKSSYAWEKKPNIEPTQPVSFPEPEIPPGLKSVEKSKTTVVVVEETQKAESKKDAVDKTEPPETTDKPTDKMTEEASKEKKCLVIASQKTQKDSQKTLASS